MFTTTDREQPEGVAFWSVRRRWIYGTAFALVCVAPMFFVGWTVLRAVLPGSESRPATTVELEQLYATSGLDLRQVEQVLIVRVDGRDGSHGSYLWATCGNQTIEWPQSFSRIPTDSDSTLALVQEIFGNVNPSSTSTTVYFGTRDIDDSETIYELIDNNDNSVCYFIKSSY